jgi:hypothetical protein
MHRLLLVLGAVTLSVARPAPTGAQLTSADSAAVILETARAFDAQGRWEVAEALYRLLLERYAATAPATAARARLLEPPARVVYGDGTTELTVWMTLYGAWLGVALPAALGAESPEPYGIGLLAGGPAGFLGGRGLARRLDLTEGQARAITLGGTWGTWQGFGWREVFEWGTPEEFCYGSGGPCFYEDSMEETFAAMVVGGLAGIATGALFANRDITPGGATFVNYGSLWGTWFGFGTGFLMDLEDDDLLAASLVGGNVALLTTALMAGGLDPSRSRVRVASILGVLGGLGGAGLDLLVQPDDEKVAIALPLLGSIAGLAMGIAVTRDSSPALLEAASDGSLLRLDDGRLRLGMPTPLPTLVTTDGPRGPRLSPALGVELFRASF